MFCNKCGNALSDGQTVCNNCGNNLGGENVSKLKSTFKGGLSTPTTKVTYNPTPVATPVKPPVAPKTSPVEPPKPVSPVETAPSAYSEPVKSAPSYGSAAYSATPSASSAPVYSAVPKDKGYVSRILMSLLLMAFVYFLPIMMTSGGFFPEEYMKSWDFLEELFSNFGDAIEGAFESAGTAGTILMYLCPIAVLISALLNSKVATCITSFVGAVGMLMMLFSIFSNAMDMGAEFGDVIEGIFDFEHTPIACGFWISLIAYLASAANATRN